MVKQSVESRFAKVTSFIQLRVNSWQEGLYQRGILPWRAPSNIKYAIKQSLTVCMTRLGEGNFRQTYEGAVHTYNTYIYPHTPTGTVCTKHTRVLVIHKHNTRRSWCPSGPRLTLAWGHKTCVRGRSCTQSTHCTKISV